MNGSPSAGGELTVLDYLRPVWRFKIGVVLVVIAAAIGTYAYANHQPRVYETSTELYVGQSELQQVVNPTVTLSSRSVADEATLLTTPAVAEAVRTKLKLPYTPNQLLSTVQATPSASEDFLTITVQSSSPQLAAVIANGFAHEFLRLRNADLVNSARTAVAQAQAQLNHVPGGAANVATRSSLEQEIQTLEAQVVSPPSQGQQVVAATVPSLPISPTPKKDAIFAAIIALVLTIIAAYLIDRTDRRVRGIADVETLFDLPVLATIPHIRGMGRKSGGAQTPLAAREPYRTLRVNMDIAREELGGRVIMVTSAMPEEGKSTIVRNLALSYQEAGASVAVVEADMRRPVLAEQFGIPRGAGLSDALSGGEVRTDRVPVNNSRALGGRIDVMLAGGLSESPSVLLTRGRLPDVLAGLAETHDIVLVDTPPLLSVSDGLTLLGVVDGVVVVVRPGRTTYPAAVRLRRTVERLHGAPIIGVVANGTEDELASHYAYAEEPAVNGAVEAVAYQADDPRTV
jgi:polysaccharide biosynthesis transport protein